MYCDQCFQELDAYGDFCDEWYCSVGDAHTHDDCEEMYDNDDEEELPYAACGMMNPENDYPVWG